MAKKFPLRVVDAVKSSCFTALCVALGGSGCSSAAEPGRKMGVGTPPGPASSGPASSVTADPTATTPTTAATAPAIPGAVNTGPARGTLRLLTNEEYRNTVRDLLKLPAPPPDTLQGESRSNGYKNFSDALTVSNTLGSQYADLAKRIAGEIADPAALAPCASGSVPRDCAATFVRSFAKQAFRRPITDAEAEGYLQLFDGELARTSYAEGLRLIVEDVLQSGNLLYRFELGTPAANTRVLDPYETASLLSYMLSSTAPDTALLAAADNNALGPTEREVQARRLLALPAGKEAVASFFRQWLEIDAVSAIQKDENIYPAFSPQLWRSMLEESGRFIDSVMWEGDGSFKSLMTSSNSFVDGPLATHYGASSTSPEGTLVPAALNPAQRMGLLTQAAILGRHSKAGESFPIGRGKMVRERFLCQKLPSPPPNLMVVPVPADPNRTARERFEAHSANPACSGCHSLIDPVGFGLESYDGVGAFRTTDNGKPVNAAGMMTNTRDIDGAFTGVELAQKLATSKEAEECFSLQAMQWTFGRATLESETDRALAANISKAAATGLDLREALIAIVKSDSFTVRAAQ